MKPFANGCRDRHQAGQRFSQRRRFHAYEPAMPFSTETVVANHLLLSSTRHIHSLHFHSYPHNFSLTLPRSGKFCKILFAILAGSAVVYFTGAQRVPLWDRDEPWYAECSR